MPRRLSASEEEPDSSSGNPNRARQPPPYAEEKKSFTSSKYDVKRKSDTLDRRKFEKSVAFTQLSPDGSRTPTSGKPAAATPKSPLSPSDDADKMTEPRSWRLSRARGPWSCSILTLAATALASIIIFAITHAFVSRQLDPKGCDVPWTRPTYIEFKDFDTEHTRFATKYHLYMIRDAGYDEDPKVKGVPVLFIPGNAGSFKQGRILAFEALEYFHNSVQQDPEAMKEGTTNMDLFAVDFNEDLSAFHGQTMLDQAEYLNDAVSYILSLYHDPRRSQREPGLPDPSSVVLVGHSMGGVIARAMLTMPNYQSNSINTILTLSAPHARAPVSFDAEMVHTYKRINDYWRQAYSQKWANDNPLWHVTLVSIAGGGLDTVVASDFASLESLVPSTHGFTVFTSGIPDVWTGADHLQMTWCVQLMKPVVRSIFKVLDVHRPGQTRPRAERMRIFKRSLLTGMEDVVEKTLPQREASTLLTLEDESNAVMAAGQRLVIREFGQLKAPKAHILPITPQSNPDSKRFTLLSDQRLDESGAGGNLEVLFCSLYPLQPGQSSALFSMNMDLSGGASGSTRLACKNVAADVIHLPASTRQSVHPFDKVPPFSYLQYQLDDLVDHQYVAVVDKATEPTQGWAIAEFSDKNDYVIGIDVGIRGLLTFGLDVKLPAERPMSTELQIPALHSSLLAFQLSLGKQACGDDAELFTPLLRQYITEPHESKFFVNVKAANISLHGIAPFMPPPLRAQTATNGLSLQFWSDPTCNSSIDVSLKIDLLGSLGKLVMRYRLVFAAFPLLVVALVLRKQFKIYDESGIFIPFAESLDLCLRSSLPLILLALSLLALSLAIHGAVPPEHASSGLFGWRGNATETPVDFTKNDLLLGSQDPIFWFLVPLFGLLSVGACVMVNYITLGVTHIFSLPYSYLTARPAWLRVENLGYVTAMSLSSFLMLTTLSVDAPSPAPVSPPARPGGESSRPVYYFS